ncbi:MAG: LytTR family DNA-binding domain-containing protein [Paludibacter sp.]|nr:LytTR family DNA-binding domain-containing protein [Paludibacter sp.]
MNGKIRTYLNISLPRPYTMPWSSLFALFVSVCIIVMVNYKHPFGAHVEKIPHYHWLLSGIGCLCMAMYLLFFRIFPLLFRRIYGRNDLPVPMEIINFILFVILMYSCNYLYVAEFLPPVCISSEFLYCIIYFTVVYNFLPLLAIYSLPDFFLRHFKKQPATQATEIIAPTPVLSKRVDLTAMKGGAYPSEEISYFKVNGNYVNLYFDSNAPKPYEVLTGSMAQLEELLLPHPEFQRCHRSYMLNTRKIRNITGNIGLLKVHLQHCDVVFKVYRNYSHKFIHYK